MTPDHDKAVCPCCGLDNTYERRMGWRTCDACGCQWHMARRAAPQPFAGLPEKDQPSNLPWSEMRAVALDTPRSRRTIQPEVAP